jgi:pimeloyl-ACP methyl ester carboxylesterase
VQKPKLLFISLLCACSTSGDGPTPDGPSGGVTLTPKSTITHNGYTYDEYEADQPKYHSGQGTPGMVRQRVGVLRPTGVSDNATVVVVQGAESPADEQSLQTIFHQFGATDVIYVQPEHRGYGISITDDDQSAPDYVTTSEAIEDTHAVLAALEPRYPGPRIAAGWSYGGTLILQHAALYPTDYRALYAVSAPIHWPYMNAQFDSFLAAKFSPAAYLELDNFLRQLVPAQNFDSTWVDREFLFTYAIGATQFTAYAPLVSIYEQDLANAHSATDLVNSLHSLDSADYNLGYLYAQSAGKTSLSHDEAMTGAFFGHTWKFQQCTELGAFWGSTIPNGVFAIRGEADWHQECVDQFPSADVPDSIPEKNLDDALSTIVAGGPKVIYVTGGTDPWIPLEIATPSGTPIASGLAWSGYAQPFGTYFFAPTLGHCPDEEDATLTAAAFAAARAAAQ